MDTKQQETQDLYNALTEPDETGVVQEMQMKQYEQTDGVSMISLFSSNKPVHDVMYFLAKNNVPFRICLGAYKGEVETSFCIPTMCMLTVLSAPWILEGQESVMHVRSIQNTLENHVQFEYLNLKNTLRFQYQGQLKLVDKAEALASEGYTYDPTGLTYSIIV